MLSRNRRERATLRYLDFTVTPEDEGRRVDAVLRRHGLSTSAVRRAKYRPRGLLLDGGDIYTSYPVHVGQTVSILADDKAPSDIVPFDGPVEICWEDDDLLVVNKPKGMVVHPAAGNYTGTLVNALLAHCGESLSGINGEIRPGVAESWESDD